MPKMSKSSRRCRRPALLVQQTAEQLVEVPTIVPYSSLHGLVEQHVDIPVPHGRGGRSCEEEVFKVHARDRIQQRLVEQNTLTFQFLMVVVFKVFARDRFLLSASSSHSPGAADEAFTEGFRTFPKNKKRCEVGSALGVGTECGLYSVHAASLSGRYCPGAGYVARRDGVRVGPGSTNISRWYGLDNSAMSLSDEFMGIHMSVRLLLPGC